MGECVRTRGKSKDLEGFAALLSASSRFCLWQTSLPATRARAPRIFRESASGALGWIGLNLINSEVCMMVVMNLN